VEAFCIVVELKAKDRILPVLYGDCVAYVEEISLVEEDYLWDNVRVYVDGVPSMRQFLVVHSPSFFVGGRSVDAYMKAESPRAVAGFAHILENERDAAVHLQVSLEAESYVERCMGWLDRAYTVSYYRADACTFRPSCKHKERAVLLTPENVREYMPLASDHFIRRLGTAQVYGYLNEGGRLVATSGVGFLTKGSFSISYTETEPEFRNRGIAKCLTSLASEPLIGRGLVGVYAADVENMASTGVAAGLGFLPYRRMRCFWKLGK